MSTKNADMQGLGIENGGYCVGCPGGTGGRVLLNSTDPPYVSHNRSAGTCSCCISVFLMRQQVPHSDVNLISWEGFENLFQKQKSFLC